MRARIVVTLKPGVLDPQGQAIEAALGNLDITGVGAVRQGKVFDIELAETDADAARTALDAMCRKLLANTVTEDYAIEIEDTTG